MHGDDYDATNDKNGSIDEEDDNMGCDNDETNEVDVQMMMTWHEASNWGKVTSAISASQNHLTLCLLWDDDNDDGNEDNDNDLWWWWLDQIWKWKQQMCLHWMKAGPV